MIQLLNIKLERVTERGYLKLHPPEVMDVRLGRSIYLIYSYLYYFPLSMNNHHHLFLQVHNHLV